MNKIIITVMVIMSFWGLCSGELEITQPLKEDSMNLSLMRLTNADKYDNKEKTDFVFVKKGTFQMGSNAEDSAEKLAHSVTLSDFYIGKFEITQAEYQSIMGNNPAEYQLNLSELQKERRPVESITWYHAVEFCNKKSIKDGLEPVYSGLEANISCDFTKNGYRLPTEAEWEYAAKGATNEPDFLYSGSNDIDSVAWHGSNSKWNPHDVGTKAPNILGIYDMSGNVDEWCNDWYGSYSVDSQTNPVGPATGSLRVFRGGSWTYGAEYSLITNRRGLDPTYGANALGFRLARNAK